MVTLYRRLTYYNVVEYGIHSDDVQTSKLELVLILQPLHSAWPTEWIVIDNNLLLLPRQDQKSLTYNARIMPLVIAYQAGHL